MNQRERQALDRHITGNYGEDQFKEEPPPEPTAREVQSWIDAFLAKKAQAHQLGIEMKELVQKIGNIVGDGSFAIDGWTLTFTFHEGRNHYPWELQVTPIDNLLERLQATQEGA